MEDRGGEASREDAGRERVRRRPETRSRGDTFQLDEEHVVNAGEGRVPQEGRREAARQTAKPFRGVDFPESVEEVRVGVRPRLEPVGQRQR